MKNLFDDDFLPRIPVGSWFSDAVDWISANLGALLDFINWLLKTAIFDNVFAGLHAVPALLMVIVLAGIAWILSSWRLGLITIVGMLLIQSMRYWPEAMETLALVLVASAFAMLFAVPIGILAGRNQTFSAVVRPVLDFMQTMPAFVYLIPTLFFWGIGETPGIVSTVIFAMPPGVRLTELGIRQVDREMVEAGYAFGAPPRQILTRIQIPLAIPTIMAGINQVIMLSLSMVVIAGIVGAGGLGGVVYSGITRLDIAKGFEGGLAVVILAIFLDRVTSALGDRSAVARANRLTGAEN